MDCEVVVIGGGLSGLSAAKWLTEAGISVIVLEAMDRVGGRLLTKIDSKVGYVDLGGSYVGPTQDYILRMAKELGVETYLIDEKEDVLHYQYGRRARNKTGDFVYTNPFVNMDIQHVVRLMDKLSEEIPSDSPWNAPNAEEWDTLTFKEFLEKNCWTREARVFFKNVMNLNVASEPYESTLLSYLYYTKQCGGFKRSMETENGAQERKFKGGSQQICEKIAKILDNSKGSKVIKNSPVVGINQESLNHVCVKTIHGNEFKTKYVILACSPIVQMKIHYNPPLPALRNQLIQKLSMGSTIKYILYYETAFWKKKGLCGTIYIEGGEEHPTFLTMDDTKPDGSFPALIGFINADHCRRLCHLTSDERKEILAKSLTEATGCCEFLTPIHYEEKNWMTEQYIGGAYTAIYPPGFFTRYSKVLRSPIDRLYFAGTETALYWAGYMNGAVESGERAAREILYDMKKITQDQIWIKEPESMDVPARPFTNTFKEIYLPSVNGFLKISTSVIMGAVCIAIGLFKKHWL